MHQPQMQAPTCPLNSALEHSVAEAAAGKCLLTRMLLRLTFVLLCGWVAIGCGGPGGGGAESYAPDDPGIAGLDVRAIAVQPDGKILISGNFTTLHPPGYGPEIARLRNARLYSDGSVDTSYNQDADGLTDGVALQSDGQVLLGGEFTSIRSLPRHHFASFPNDPSPQELSNSSHRRVQWLRGGTSPKIQDVTFEVSTDSGATYALLGHGTRISGGWELTGLSLPSRGLLRARARTAGGLGNNSVGIVETVVPVTTIVEDLNPEVAGGAVYATVTQPDGKVIIAGSFTSVHGVARHNAARLNVDGSLDMGFDPSPNDIVLGAAVQADGKILLGGIFTTIQPNGFPTPIVMDHLARLNPDGTLDLSFFDPVVGYFPSPGAPVTSIVIQPDGVILLAGKADCSCCIWYAQGASGFLSSSYVSTPPLAADFHRRSGSPPS